MKATALASKMRGQKRIYFCKIVTEVANIPSVVKLLTKPSHTHLLKNSIDPPKDKEEKTSSLVL